MKISKPVKGFEYWSRRPALETKNGDFRKPMPRNKQLETKELFEARPQGSPSSFGGSLKPKNLKQSFKGDEKRQQSKRLKNRRDITGLRGGKTQGRAPNKTIEGVIFTKRDTKEKTPRSSGGMKVRERLKQNAKILATKQEN